VSYYHVRITPADPSQSFDDELALDLSRNSSSGT